MPVLPSMKTLDFLVIGTVLAAVSSWAGPSAPGPKGRISARHSVMTTGESSSLSSIWLSPVRRRWPPGTRSLVISSDGRWWCASDQFGRIHVGAWNESVPGEPVPDQPVIWSWGPTPGGAPAPIDSFFFSEDSSLLVVQISSSTVLCFRREDGAVRGGGSCTGGRAIGFGFAPEGRGLWVLEQGLTAVSSGSRDPQPARLEFALDPGFGYPRERRTLPGATAYALGRGHREVIGYRDGRVCVASPRSEQNGDALAPRLQLPGPITNLILSPARDWILASGRDGHLGLIDLDHPETDVVLLHKPGIRPLSLGSGGQLILASDDASGSSGAPLLWIDPGSGDVRGSARSGHGRLHSGVLAPSGTGLTVTSEGEVGMWNPCLPESQLVEPLGSLAPGPFLAASLGVSPTRVLLLDEEHLTCLDPASAQEVVQEIPIDAVDMAKCPGSDEVLLLGSHGEIWRTSVLATTEGVTPVKIDVGSPEGRSVVRTVMSSDGKIMVRGSYGAVEVLSLDWDLTGTTSRLKGGRGSRTIGGFRGPVTVLALDGSGALLAAAGESDDALRILDTESGRATGSLPFPHVDPSGAEMGVSVPGSTGVTAALFDSTGQGLFVARRDGSLGLYRLADGTCVRALIKGGYGAPIQGLVPGPGRLVAALTGGKVLVVDTGSPMEMSEPKLTAPGVPEDQVDESSQAGWGSVRLLSLSDVDQGPSGVRLIESSASTLFLLDEVLGIGLYSWPALVGEFTNQRIESRAEQPLVEDEVDQDSGDADVEPDR